jgi:redox-sensitive bicupin YhaK (pirin superfamily)
VLGAGDVVRIEAQAGGKVLLSTGRPLNEPITRHGPFVMNTRQEIYQAFADYQAGRFEE